MGFLHCFEWLFSAHGREAFASFMSGWIIAGTISSVIGILGLLDLIPRELVFAHDEGLRIKAFFKDPNVYGPHLVAPLVFIVVL